LHRSYAKTWCSLNQFFDNFTFILKIFKAWCDLICGNVLAWLVTMMYHLEVPPLLQERRITRDWSRIPLTNLVF
jgi:hypothetical protein